MAKLDEFGREILDQTPVALPAFGAGPRPEPIHQRIRRMILESLSGIKGDDVETLEDANDFEIADDPSSFDTEFTEPDLMPTMPPAPSSSAPFTEAELAAAREAVMNLRKQQKEPSNAGSEGAVSSAPDAPAEPA